MSRVRKPLMATGTAVSLAVVGLAISLTGALAKNLCEGGADSQSCVSCFGKDCRLGAAHSDARTGVVTVSFPTKSVRVEMPGENTLSMIQRSRGDVYLLTGATTGKVTDTATVCSINVDLMPELELMRPWESAAPALLKLFSPKNPITQRSTRFGAYGAIDSVSEVPKSHVFELARTLVYENLFVIKACGFTTKPNFTNKRWNDIKVTILPQNVVF